MKLRPVILITLIIVLPLAALTWAILRIAENEQVVVQQRFRELMEDRLQDVNVNVVAFVEDLERSLSRITAIDDFELESLRQTNRSEPRLLQLFVLNPEGQLSYPDPAGDLNTNERQFLVQAAKMFTGKDLKETVIRSEQEAVDQLGNAVSSVAPTMQSKADSEPLGRSQAALQYRSSPGLDQQSQAPVQKQLVEEAYRAAPVQNLEAFEESSGWFVWYWDRGLNLIYWQRRPSGHIVGCALERARWMADLVAQLPETVASDPGSERSIETRVRLVNSAAAPVYQWGNFEPPDDAKPLCEVPLAVPLASWRLQCFVPVAQLTAGTGRSVHLSLFASLAAVAAALGVISFFFVREYARDMKEASQQVSFVNQVSHELKTPLTNIRMYAELLERDLDGVSSAEAEKPKQRLEIILSEGQRLTRLIGNVLTFARQQRKTLQLQPREVRPDQLIERIMDRFRPAFVDQQIETTFDGNADSAMQIDPDFLEQILGNLISNVEKYAASGGSLNVRSSVESGVLTLDICDAGPGIPPAKRGAVFEPFARVTNDVSYAAGTGIGLSIARELARLHGGDVLLMDSDSGCWFRATIKACSI
ncbi:sensor histidine kinase [Fuerstiella marisgermanici]|uniref:histidine kinase n=1 Tax=Fuerstiella marisgermanici TaxID=1891926 RepID=A0A1P8WLU1_9PLAN|nr:HAMP domain-containing sensor histidine kinase [Fuerstiella marisgermanici]APZ95032.1 Sensor protein KdpD [Fuerstiella marisgermanici]